MLIKRVSIAVIFLLFTAALLTAQQSDAQRLDNLERLYRAVFYFEEIAEAVKSPLTDREWELTAEFERLIIDRIRTIPSEYKNQATSYFDAEILVAEDYIYRINSVSAEAVQSFGIISGWFSLHELEKDRDVRDSKSAATAVLRAGPGAGFADIINNAPASRHQSYDHFLDTADADDDGEIDPLEYNAALLFLDIIGDRSFLTSAESYRIRRCTSLIFNSEKTASQIAALRRRITEESIKKLRYELTVEKDSYITLPNQYSLDYNALSMYRFNNKIADRFRNNITRYLIKDEYYKTEEHGGQNE